MQRCARAVDDDVIGPPGEFWRFLTQGFAGEAHGAEQPGQALTMPLFLPPFTLPKAWNGTQWF